MRAAACWRGSARACRSGSTRACCAPSWCARLRRRSAPGLQPASPTWRRSNDSRPVPARSPFSTLPGRRYSCSCCSCFTGCSACWRCAPDSCCSRSHFSTRPGPRGSSRRPARRPPRPRTSSNRCGPAARRCRGWACRERCCPVRGALRHRVLDRTLAVSDRNGLYGVLTKTLRLFLQSMMLGLGAWLALRGEVSPGIMIAGSILLGQGAGPDRPGGRPLAAVAAGVGWAGVRSGGF